MASDNSQVKVTKVRPYPIHCTLKTDNEPVPLKCEIMRLEQIGFIFRIPSKYFKVGEEYTSEFEIPVLHHKVVEKVKIIKTREEAAALGSPRLTTVEVHFLDRFHKSEGQIRLFLNRIGQKGT